MTDIKRARVTEKSNYASFRRCLIGDFKKLSEDDLKHLGVLIRDKGYGNLGVFMRDKGYRRFYDKKEGMEVNGYPRPAQLDYAYGVLKRIAISKHVSEMHVREVYHKRAVWRALRNQEIGGRKYRRGQFIPTRNK